MSEKKTKNLRKERRMLLQHAQEAVQDFRCKIEYDSPVYRSFLSHKEAYHIFWKIYKYSWERNRWVKKEEPLFRGKIPKSVDGFETYGETLQALSSFKETAQKELQFHVETEIVRMCDLYGVELPYGLVIEEGQDSCLVKLTWISEMR